MAPAMESTTTMPRDANGIKVPATREMFTWIRETAARDGIDPGALVYNVIEAAMSTRPRPEPVAPLRSDE